jgi:nickel transport protein
MPCRNTALTPPALLLALALLLAFAGAARAHRLEADYRIRADGKIQIEAWFDIGGAPPRGAHVEVLHADSRMLAEGQLDEQGIYVFSIDELVTLQIVVSAGAGHRKELHIPVEALVRNRVGIALATTGTGDPVFTTGIVHLLGTSNANNPVGSLVDRSPRIGFSNLLLGVSLLLLVALLATAFRRGRQFWKAR